MFKKQVKEIITIFVCCFEMFLSIFLAIPKTLAMFLVAFKFQMRLKQDSF